MSIENHLVFDNVKCCDKNATLALGKLSLSITYFDNINEIEALPLDKKSIVADECFTEFEFVFEEDHANKKVQMQKVYTFEIQNKSGLTGSTVQSTVFYGILMDLPKVFKLDNGRQQRYFYQGVKIRNFIHDTCAIFNFFGQKKLFIRYFDMRINDWRSQTVILPNRNSLIEFVEKMKSQNFYESIIAYDISKMPSTSNETVINDAEIFVFGKHLP